MIVNNNISSLLEIRKTIKSDRTALILVNEYSGEIPDKVIGLVTERMKPADAGDFMYNSIPNALIKFNTSPASADEFVKATDRAIMKTNIKILSCIFSDLKKNILG